MTHADTCWCMQCLTWLIVNHHVFWWIYSPLHTPFTRCFLSISTFSRFGLQAVWFGHLGTSTICLILLWKYGRLRQYNECVCPCCLTSGAFNLNPRAVTYQAGHKPTTSHLNEASQLVCCTAISTWSDCYGHWAPLTFVSTSWTFSVQTTSLEPWGDETKPWSTWGDAKRRRGVIPISSPQSFCKKWSGQWERLNRDSWQGQVADLGKKWRLSYPKFKCQKVIALCRF